MSFGALSANAIRALNKGASMGHFAHDTGEGSISRYHRESGGDLIWELGTGYFGCRNVDCVSPSAHSAFSTPVEMLQFIAQLRELSGGKPVGFKLCIGHPWEFMATVKAMLKTGILPDFIVIDGAEGGTGAAPVESGNHVGTPLRAGLQFAHNTLRGAGLRDRIKIGASGKIVSATR